MKRIFSLLLLLIAVHQAGAHALWIETSNTGLKGKPHEAKVFFGEFASNERDTAAKWFSNLEEFELWVTSPSGKKEQLKTNIQIDHFAASFTPTENGIYTLSISIEVKDLHRKSKIFYYCNAAVAIGTVDKGSNSLATSTNLSLQLDARKPQSGNSIKGTVFLNGKPLAKSKVSIASESGKKKDLVTDEKGQIDFILEETGTYFFEAFNIIKETGMHNGKEYDTIYHCDTHCLNVTK